MSKTNPLEAVGWKFWGGSFFVVVGPSIYAAWNISYSSVSPYAYIMYGLIVAALSASIVTWGVNSTLQRAAARRRKQERKKKPKKKK